MDKLYTNNPNNESLTILHSKNSDNDALIINEPDESIPSLYKPHDTDAGYDTFSLEEVTLWPFKTKKIKLNVRVIIPPGMHLEVTGRSGISSWGVLTHRGIIDPGYTGIIRVIMTNLKPWPVRFTRGQRIAQILAVEHKSPTTRSVKEKHFEELASSNKSKRKDTGFGYSGLE